MHNVCMSESSKQYEQALNDLRDVNRQLQQKIDRLEQFIIFIHNESGNALTQGKKL